MSRGGVPVAALPVRIRHRAVRVRHRAVPCPVEVSRSRPCPSASGIGPCHVPWRCPGRGLARPRSRVLHSVVLRIRGAFFCRCTRSDDRVVTLYANRHFNPINRTRSRPSNETLHAVASSRFSIAALYAVASSRCMKSDHHEVIFSLFQAGRRSCSATYVYSPCPCRTLWPVEELLF